jgi:hypothetical protein
MPSPARAWRRHTAVLWPYAGIDDYNEPLRGEPVEKRVRWVAGTRQVSSPAGTPISIDVTVVADEEFAVGGTMALGTLSSWLGTDSAAEDNEIMEIVSYNPSYDLKGRVTRHEHGLTFFRDTPPEEA